MSETEGTTTPAEVLRRAIEDGYNAGDMSVAEELFVREVRALDGSGETYPRERFIAQHDATERAIPDAHIEILDVVADDSKAVAHFEFTGTFENEMVYQGDEEKRFEPNGEELSYTGTYIAEVEDGEIVGWTGHTEMLEPFAQMGIVPSFEELGEEASSEEE